jgi:hypothetical protein
LSVHASPLSVQTDQAVRPSHPVCPDAVPARPKEQKGGDGRDAPPVIERGDVKGWWARWVEVLGRLLGF